MFIEPHIGRNRREEKNGWIEVISGCMFSGKTEELIRRLNRALIAKQKVEIFKPTIDRRYDDEKIVSHSEREIRSTPVNFAGDILLLAGDCDVVGIDEAQFFDDAIVDICNTLANNGKRVIVAGLDMDYTGKPFGPMPNLLAVAEFVTKVHAICAQTGELASFSYRLDSNQSQVLLGEKDHYEARSRKAFYSEQKIQASKVLHKTRGIVFRLTRYGETSIIVSIFTELFGLQSYIVNGARSKSGKGKIALYQPLTLLELVVYHKENASILRIKEVRCYHPYQTLTSDFRKSTIALFLAEVVNKSVKEQSHAREISQFLSEAFIALDQMKTGFENFHLVFLIQLSRYLGFGPFQSNEIMTPFDTDQAEQKILGQLLSAELGATLTITQVQRRNLLDVLIRFYATHVDSLGEIKSLAVVREMVN